eukprot:TRINITY_DN2183_c0_g4_i1.p1 TRINITY_DN2183_c0_g4~~TRINITY_DN2183_c0_g4_i1.p1  ORF type:complete len:502 (-),score=173.45 TRINITY_DN2183_c0_g4_i1:61-1566(-)
MNEKQLNQIENNLNKSFSTWLLYSIFGIFPLVFSYLIVLKLYLTNEWKQIGNTIYQYQLPELITQSIPFFFIFIAFEVFFCLIKKKCYYRLNDSLNSLFMGVIQQMLGLFIKSLAVFPYAYIHQNFALFNFSEQTKSSWLMWILIFLWIDMMYYWFHRFAHEWNALWAAHVVHHSSNEYNLTTALRQGALQPLFSWCFYLPLAFFIPLPLYAWHSQFNTVYQFWIHTKVINKLPAPIEFIFNTPSHHRVHHASNEYYLDKNYGGTLIIFDRIFGTFKAETQQVIYGITCELPTWNPFWLQTHHWFEMIETTRKIPNFFSKIRVFCDRGPIFNSQILNLNNNNNKSHSKTKIKNKYDSTSKNIVFSLYACFQSLTIFAFTYVLAADARKIIGAPENWDFLGALFVIFSTYTISLLFDNKSYDLFLEIIRLILLPILFLPLLSSQQHQQHQQYQQELSSSFETIKQSKFILFSIYFSILSFIWLLLAFIVGDKRSKINENKIK